MAQQPITVEIPAERINKTLDVLSVLSLGKLDLEKAQIEVTNEDEFAFLEHTINELSRDLTAKRVECEQARETIEAQRRVIRNLVGPLSELLKLVGLQIAPKP